MKVLWLANIPSPYSVDFFSELGKLCELTVLFERQAAADRDKSWQEFKFQNFTGKILRGISYGADKALCFGVLKYLHRGFDAIVVSNMATLTGILAVLWLRLLKIPYVIQGDGGFAGSGEGLKEKLKKYLISGAALCLSTGASHDEYYRAYGARAIDRIPFTSLWQRQICQSPATAEEKQALRQKLSLPQGRLILSVGQFIPRKGFDVLLSAFRDFPDDVSLCILGGEPPQSYLDLLTEQNRGRCIFLPFVRHEDIGQYFRAADLFVLPTREDIWGLVINEAMAFGLPVITTDRCAAGLELVDSTNGALVAVEDVQGLRQAMLAVLSEDLTAMGCHSLKKMAEYTFENTADAHIHCLRKWKA